MQSAEKLSITLPVEMVRAIRTKVESGAYASDSEVIREALSVWLERDRHIVTLESVIDRGIAGIEANKGKTTDQVRRSLLDGLAKGGN